MNENSQSVVNLRLRPAFKEPSRSQDIGFKGRAGEVHSIANIVESRRAATLLVSGSRGVGKSTLVQEALTRCRNNDRLEVHLTIPTVELDDAGEVRDQTLRVLARALYYTAKDRGDISSTLLQRLRDVYDKSFLKELEHQTSASGLLEAEAKHVDASVVVHRYDAAPGVKLVMGILAGVVAACGGAAVFLAALASAGWWTAVAVLVSIIAVATLSGIRFSSTKSETDDITQRGSVTNEATQIARYDLTTDALEFELAAVLRELRDEKKPCVFVIDELDKIKTDAADASRDSNPVSAMVSSLKNFFTLGAGVFIFITDDDFYWMLEEQANETHGRSIEHTLFTDKLFVHELHYSAVEELIDAIVEAAPTEDHNYRMVRNFLCWRARNHVFDLLQAVSELAEIGEDGETRLRPRVAGMDGDRWREGNLPGDWRTAAGLQKYVGAIYDEFRRPHATSHRFNHAVLELSYEILDRLMSENSLSLAEDPINAGAYVALDGLTQAERVDLAGAGERLVAKMARFGSCEISSNSAADEAGTTVTTRTVKLLRSAAYPPQNVGQITVPTSYESGYSDLVGYLDVMADHLDECGVPSESLDAELKAVRDVRDRIANQSVHDSVPHSDVTSAARQADDLLDAIKSLAFDQVFRAWATQEGARVATDLEALDETTGQPWTSSLIEFPQVVQVLKDRNLKYWLASASGENQLLMVVFDSDLDGWDDLVEAYRSSLTGEKGRERRKQRLPMINVVPKDAPPIAHPAKMIDVLSKFNGSFMSWFRPPEPNGGNKTVKNLAGWNTFRFERDLANLAELPKQLEKASFLVVPQSV